MIMNWLTGKQRKQVSVIVFPICVTSNVVIVKHWLKLQDYFKILQKLVRNKFSILKSLRD